MWRIAIRIRLLGQARLAEVILLRVTKIHRKEKSVRWMLLGVLPLAASLWISQPMNPPERYFDRPLLEELRHNSPRGTPDLKAGPSIAEVERVLDCPLGTFGKPEYVTSPHERLPYPIDDRSLEQQWVGTTHQSRDDDAVIVDRTFDAKGWFS
ncbi:MAG: hypothetical protein ACK6D3_16410 [Planctomycetaceae bacterium]|jgi:hypothetical protein